MQATESWEQIVEQHQWHEIVVKLADAEEDARCAEVLAAQFPEDSRALEYRRVLRERCAQLRNALRVLQRPN